MISSAISADLGRQEGMAGNSEALATVTGIVDGTGSMGAALGQVREMNIGSLFLLSQTIGLNQYRLHWLTGAISRISAHDLQDLLGEL